MARRQDVTRTLQIDVEGICQCVLLELHIEEGNHFLLSGLDEL